MTPKQPRQILIPVTVGEDYQDGLARRLDEYGIKQRELADELGVGENQISRWIAGKSPDTGRRVSIGIENVIRIERAIVTIRTRHEREKRKTKE